MANRSKRPLFSMPWSLEARERISGSSPDETATAKQQAPQAEPPSSAAQDSWSEAEHPAPGLPAPIRWSPALQAETPPSMSQPLAPARTAVAPAHSEVVVIELETDHTHDQGTAHEELLCAELQPEAALGLDSTNPQWSSTPLLDPSLTFRLHSDPTATRLIYLDFDGHTTKGTAWNNSTMGASFYSPAYDTDGNKASFSNGELTSIQQIWQRVASDFAPFDVDVTTQAPPLDWLSRSSSSDPNYGIRVVITSFGPYSSSAAGVSFVGTFTANTDTPAFVYNRTVIGASEAISHEVGHTLGLSHDGKGTSTYYSGHGSGETGWAPIMGASYSRSVTTWDIGQYTGSNNGSSTANYGKGPDDVAVITKHNGFGYQPDLVGNTASTATPLQDNSGRVNLFGTIETRQDVDAYSFDLLTSGDLNLSFDPYWTRAYVDADGNWGGSSTAWASRVSDLYSSTSYVENGSNLDLAVSLFNSDGRLLATANPVGLAANMSLTALPAGHYLLSLDGTGYGDPMAATPSGYTDGDSMGFYRISGTISGTGGNLLAMAATSEEGSPGGPGNGGISSSDPITGLLSQHLITDPGDALSRPTIPAAITMPLSSHDWSAIPTDNVAPLLPSVAANVATPLAGGVSALDHPWFSPAAEATA